MSETPRNETEVGQLQLDAAAWKNKSTTTYTSLLDIYNASDLFTPKKTALYEQKRAREIQIQSARKDYVFLSEMEEEISEEEIINEIFSEEIQLSKIKNYETHTQNSRICAVLASIFAFLVFGICMLEYNNRRRNRREEIAAEINMENYRTK